MFGFLTAFFFDLLYKPSSLSLSSCNVLQSPSCWGRLPLDYFQFVFLSPILSAKMGHSITVKGILDVASQVLSKGE